MKQYKWTILMLLVLLTNDILNRKAIATERLISSQSLSPTSSIETSQFGRLVGNWKIHDFSLNQKGEWQPGNGADWNFYWILGGAAIQDDWISPPMGQQSLSNTRQFGTNIRIFNPKLNRWEMAWAANTGNKIDFFSAKEINNQLVMQGELNGAESRITFYDITQRQFLWKLEQQNAGIWKEIYRIKAIKVN